MNALASDQANRLAREIVTRPVFADLTAGLYVGESPSEPSTTVRHLEGDRYTVITDRERIREEPPDILLTNYKMLDFLLIRARDAALWRHNRPDIRLLLPESHFGGSEESIHSFIAALQLGLQRRFRGAVDHLRIARDVRLAQGEESPRQFLVIYDSVPGGTGYLKELMRDTQPLFDVFRKALDDLKGCGCATHEEKDGCYRSPEHYAEVYGEEEDVGVLLDNLTSERCLLHVAATRPKRYLLVSRLG